MLDNLLEGVRVIDLTQNVAGPFCTQVLGDFGAEVIKIERPGVGDDTRAWVPPEIGGHSSTFLSLNRNKRSICLDLNQPESIKILRELAKSADVIIHSMKPGSAEARGFGPEELMALNPRLVYCAISAFGEVGKMAKLPGYDPLVQAFSGVMSVTGNQNDDPVRVSVSLIDMGTGMWSAMGIFAALMSRERTGKGTQVNTSLLETGLSWMTVFVASYLASGQLPRKMGSAMAMAAPYQLFKTSDGHIFIAAGNDGLFVKVCDALGCPELAQDERFVTNTDRINNRDALCAAIEQVTTQHTAAELVERLRKTGAPCSELNNVAQAIEHEQVRALDMVPSLPAPGIPDLRTVALPIRADGKRVGKKSPPPFLGADTSELLQELGYDAAAQQELRGKGIIN
ncbi:MAG: CaiB/BaiF CoA-transferase family protein [Burkholderiaceae bacterium]